MPSIIHLKETESTNTYIRALSLDKKLEEGTSVYTDFQTRGRGQRGNGWESECGLNLNFSFLVYPTHIEAPDQFILSQLISLSIRAVLSEYTSDITIKWPNDIYWRDKKICGILIENDLSESGISKSIIGIGINLNQEVFTSNAPNPISLKQITGQEYGRKEILNKVVNHFLYLYNQSTNESVKEEVRQEYKSYLFRKSGFHLYKDSLSDSVFEASIYNVKDDGTFVLQLKSGDLRSFAFKEVQCIF